VASIGTDKSEGAMVYDPSHPDADKNGYVRMPNVRMTDELMDLMNSRRLYEANAHGVPGGPRDVAQSN